MAKKLKINTLNLLGNDGGKAKKYSINNIIIKSKNTARIQEMHIFLGHFILKVLKKNFYPQNKFSLKILALVDKLDLHNHCKFYLYRTLHFCVFFLFHSFW